MKATTKEQSTYLLSLGVNPQSADMYYGYKRVKPELFPYSDIEIGSFCLPCWSLEALLKLMPEFELWTTSEKKYSITCGWYQSGEFDDIFDAVYELIVNLLKSKEI